MIWTCELFFMVAVIVWLLCFDVSTMNKREWPERCRKAFLDTRYQQCSWKVRFTVCWLNGLGSLRKDWLWSGVPNDHVVLLT